MKEKVVIGMSGGVDSSVAAYILKEQGYDVIGVTMKIWQEENKECSEESEDSGGCCGLSAVDDARAVAQRLDIPYYVLNFQDDFKEKVIDYFVDAYLEGKTPNPCIACNRYVKWESLLHKSIQLGADYIATGHYARVFKDETSGRYTLKNAKTMEKDQTYALYNLSQHQLAHTLMPAGDYTKDEIRAIARKIGLNVAEKKDSQEICFIPDNDYASFIQTQTNQPSIPGDFVDEAGTVLGQHKGITHYTIGQRKGLGIAFGKPMFVRRILASENKIELCDNASLFQTTLRATDLNFMSIEKLEGKKEVMGKIRYSHKPSKCTIHMEDDQLVCTFEEPQRAITPGQSVVFYENDHIVCGGTIL